MTTTAGPQPEQRARFLPDPRHRRLDDLPGGISAAPRTGVETVPPSLAS